MIIKNILVSLNVTLGCYDCLARLLNCNLVFVAGQKLGREADGEIKHKFEYFQLFRSQVMLGRVSCHSTITLVSHLPTPLPRRGETDSVRSHCC